MSFEEEYNLRLRVVLAQKADIPPERVESLSVEIQGAGSEEDSRGIDTYVEVSGFRGGSYRAVHARFDTMADLIRALDAVPDE
jgi:hypothetical protein